MGICYAPTFEADGRVGREDLWRQGSASQSGSTRHPGFNDRFFWVESRTNNKRSLHVKDKEIVTEEEPITKSKQNPLRILFSVEFSSFRRVEDQASNEQMQEVGGSVDPFLDWKW